MINLMHPCRIKGIIYLKKNITEPKLLYNEPDLSIGHHGAKHRLKASLEQSM